MTAGVDDLMMLYEARLTKINHYLHKNTRQMIPFLIQYKYVVYIVKAMRAS